MEVYSDIEVLADKYNNIVVALGNFDGLHKGHQKLINETVKKAEEIRGTPTILTFYPHPLEILNPDKSPPKLMDKEEKINHLRKMGVKLVILLQFNTKLSAMSPEAFVKNILVDKLKVKAVYVGFNYTFGHNGEGDADKLIALGEQYKFKVEVIPPVCIDDLPISSTRIRKLLVAGRVDEAGNLLGHLPYIKGKVVKGDRRGRTIGFPTANINNEDNIIIPANGVYAVKVYINEYSYNGVCNIGYKPTFKNEMLEQTIEVNIFDFNQEIYNIVVRMEFVQYLRSEKKFVNVEDLIKQINDDVEAARGILKSAKLA